MSGPIIRIGIYVEEVLSPDELTPYLNGKPIVRDLTIKVGHHYVTGEKATQRYARRFAVRPRAYRLVGIFQEQTPRLVYRVVIETRQRVWPS